MPTFAFLRDLVLPVTIGEFCLKTFVGEVGESLGTRNGVDRTKGKFLAAQKRSKMAEKAKFGGFLPRNIFALRG